MKKTSVSIIVAAYNEEKNLGEAVTTIDDTLKSAVTDYELIIIDDCSKDRTGAIAEEFAQKNPRIRAAHFKKNRGLGAVYEEGLRLATKEYVMLLPGDNGIHQTSIAQMLEKAGDADIVMSYTQNQKDRPIMRRLVSRLFTTALNALFGLNLRYYNGMVLYKLSLARQAKITTSSFAFQAEILVHLLRKNSSYIEVPMIALQENEGPTTNIFRIKNMIGVCATMAKLFFRTHFSQR
ncbi:glycosyltransferase family 2 protein [Candidatus Woesearchaeota archaeon]|nr:glycosyltransferase family 2 protein [Candidatus Woesearchaeota archaeon]